MTISPLSIFNALVPKDGRSIRLAKGLPYGPHARHALDVYAPRAPHGPLPVVMFIYGGSWNDGDRGNYGFVGRALASAGYLVAVPDYRVQPDAEYPVFLDDCAAAFHWLAEHAGVHGGDGERMVLAGHSAGAYNAAMLALHPRYLRGGPSYRRLRGVLGLSGPYDFFPFDGPISLRTFGAAPEPRDTQPIHHAGRDAVPFWLGTGDADTLVRPRNSVALAAALRSCGVEAELRRYAGLTHADPLLALSTLLRHRAPVRSDMLAFLDEITRTRNDVASG